jgi:TolB-like protein/Tfp pilus assembly protein PilF
MSADPKQEYFSDGIAEDIITALSRFHQFFVIARNSSFTYKGEAVDVKQVARELGVQYVIEGSVRRAGNRVRITAQLIDATSGNHIWAERYDRELDDIFTVQDDITERIAMAVGPELDTTEMTRAHRKSLPELGAWELLARANWHGLKFTESDVGLAKSLCAKALEIDPDNARIYASLSACYAIDAAYGWRRPPKESHARALEFAEKAVALDKEDERTHLRLGAALLLAKRHEEAIQRYRTAIKLNPNYSIALGQLGMVLVWAHKHDEALELLHKAMQLSPKDGNLIWYIIHVGWHHFIEKRYDEALIWAEKALYEEPKFPSGLRLKASAQGMLGNLAEARVAYEHFDEIVPGATIAAMVEAMPFAYEDDAQRFAEGLRRAGMPEE